MSEPRKLRRSTIKEELVALTGDAIDALVLNQFIKYQASASDNGKYIEEERARFASVGTEVNIPAVRGWFYKNAKEVSAETMVGLSESNMRARIKRLVKAGWVAERTNPHHKWDRTIQYRVDIMAVDTQLRAIGYALDGWLVSRISETEDASSETKDGDDESEDRSPDSEDGIGQNESAIPSGTTSRKQQDVQTSNNSVVAPNATLASQLQAAGLSAKSARKYAATCPDVARRQLAWLPLRNPGTNAGGLLNQAIEGDWSEPGRKRDPLALAPRPTHSAPPAHPAPITGQDKELRAQFDAMDAQGRSHLQEAMLAEFPVLAEKHRSGWEPDVLEKHLWSYYRTIMREEEVR